MAAYNEVDFYRQALDKATATRNNMTAFLPGSSVNNMAGAPWTSAVQKAELASGDYNRAKAYADMDAIQAAQQQIRANKTGGIVAGGLVIPGNLPSSNQGYAAPAAGLPAGGGIPATGGTVFGGGGVSGGNVVAGGSVNTTLAGLPANNGGYDQILALLKPLLSQYSKESAVTDATALMNQRAQAEREKNMPALQRAVEGAGTSAGSMQALLSQKFATDTAQAGAALGAEQAKAYGGIQASLASTLGGMGSSGDPYSKLLAGLLQTQMQGQNQKDVANISASSGQPAQYSFPTFTGFLGEGSASTPINRTPAVSTSRY